MIENKGKSGSGDKMDKLDKLDLSKMSPDQRARLSALIEVDGDASLREHLLGAVGRSASSGLRPAREIPDRWTQIFVLDRLEEAFLVLANQPAAAGPKQYGNGMPTVVQERLTNKDLIDLYESGELAKMHEDRNRVRIPATAAQVTRMEQALRWPFEYLADKPLFARSLSQRALWAALKYDIRRRCEALRIDHAGFNQQWQAGLQIVTAALIARKVPVS
jgi:hypothetical protein